MTTIYDIAKKVGCAPSTVSKYITKHGYVSQAMGQKIASAMRELNYHYNGVARALSTSTNNRIGVMVPFLDHPYFQGLVAAIACAASDVNKTITIFPTAYSVDSERQYIAELEHRLIDGLIITSHALSYQEIIKADTDRPIVFCETIADPAVRSVNVDRYTTFIKLFQTLKEQGYERIGCLFIRQPQRSITTRETLSAYQQVFGKSIP